MRLGLLLPMTPAGKYIRGAATLAIAEINADPSIMQGRRLEYLWADSGCNPIAGLRAIQELLFGAKPIHGVIGAGCSSACEVIAFVTAERGLPQVCPLPHSCWSPRLRFFLTTGLVWLFCRRFVIQEEARRCGLTRECIFGRNSFDLFASLLCVLACACVRVRARACVCVRARVRVFIARYPTFARTVTKKSGYAPSIVGLMKWGEWHAQTCARACTCKKAHGITHGSRTRARTCTRAHSCTYARTM